MAFRRIASRFLFALALIALPFALGCTRQDFPQSTFHSHSDFAHWLEGLNLILIYWSIGIFVVVQALLTIAIVKFRNRPGAPEPKPVHGHTGLEIAWTIVPALILTAIAIPTVKTIFITQSMPARTDLTVRAIGHQWWWEFQYPDLGVVTANEMHVPVGRTVVVEITSADILHSFWVPAMGGKRDAVPTRTNRIWFTADTVGVFDGQCMEFCGMSHANMRMKLISQEPEAFEAWVAHQKTPPAGTRDTSAAASAMAARPDTAAALGAVASPDLVGKGRELFSQSACVACHTIQGVSGGVIGPNLTHFASRSTFAGSMFANNDENLARWIEDPPKRKPGALMPPLGLGPDQVSALVAYLRTLQ